MLDELDVFGGTGGKYSLLCRGWVKLVVLASEVDDPVRLKRPRGVLVGKRAASPDTLPRAGLYIASGNFGSAAALSVSTLIF